MKKRIFALLMAGVMITAAGCAGSSDTASSSETEETEDADDDSSYSTDVDVEAVTGTGASEEYPDSTLISLGEYIGVEVGTYGTEVTDEDLQEEIETILSYYAESVETDKTTVEDGDIVNIDYTGYEDGEAFDGGSAEGYELEIGSDTFIDGFEDGLIGAEVGETVSLDLTFPEDYYSTDLAGAAVVFEVTVNAIVEYETPEWTDDFVSENLGYDTAGEYEEILLEELEDEKEEEAYEEKAYDALLAVVEASEIELADSDIETFVESYEEYYSYYASVYSMEFEDFISTYLGMTEDEFYEQVRELADYQIRCELVVEAIALAEGITITEDEYLEELEEVAEYYGYELEDMEDVLDVEGMIQSLIYDKTVDFITDNAVEVS